MKGVVLVGLLAAVTAHGAAAEAIGLRLPAPTTLASVRAFVEGFAQDGNHIVWATDTGRCGRNVVLRTLSSGRSTFLDARNGPMCRLTQIAGEVQPWMALAGTRALWGREIPSLSLWTFAVFTAAPGGGGERQVGGSALVHNPSDEHDGLRPVPMSGRGKTLVFADISDVGAEEGSGPVGVYRVIGNHVRHVAGTRGAFSVAVAGSSFALARAIPAGCACNSRPAWSPDGRRIAFLSGENGGQDGAPQLMVMNADGTDLRKVITEASSFAWSPEGGALAVGQDDQILIVNADGSRVRAAARGEGNDLAWSPDGRHLAYTSFGHLFVVPARGGSAVDFDTALDEGPRWSPDSRRVAYTRSVAGRKRVYVAAVAGGARADLGTGAWPAWSPNASAIALIREDGIYVTAPDGSDSHRIAPGSFNDVAWSPDAKWIAYSSGAEGLWIARPDGGAARKLVPDSRGIYWSPDSRAIADQQSVVEVDSGIRHIVPQDLDCEPQQWSPDGTRLLCVIPTISPDVYYGGEVAVVDAREGNRAALTHTKPLPARIVVETRNGAEKLLSSFQPPEGLRGLAWNGSRFALLIARSKTHATIEIRSGRGKLLRSVDVPRPWFDQFSMSGHWVVFRAGNSVRLLDIASGRTAVLAKTKKASIVGLSIVGRRVAWAESTSRLSRIRAVVLVA